jgi:NADH-quinone oxidoreductase subunit L
MRNMGGLKSKMPLTFWTFLIATLAIAGIPGFSGFFSKDEILWKTFASDRIWLWVIGLVTAGITAFYMFRLVYKTFYGEFRGGKNDEHIYESPYVMTIPLIILAVLSVIGGYIGIPAVIGGGNQFESFLEPVFAQGEHILVNSEIHTSSTELTLMIVSIVAAIIGIYIAFLLYRKKPEIPQNFVAKNVTLHRVVYNKYYVDEIYRAIVIVPLVKFSENLDAFFDMKIVDGSVNGIATVFRNLSAQLRKMQTGFLQNYALMMTIGIVIILGWLLLK